jgi:type VI secretion system secreted protein Hcp
MYDAFCQVKGIDGDSTDDKHKNWIEILSYSHGVSQASSVRSSAGASSGGRTDHQDLSIVKRLDKASPKLFLACCKGDHIAEVKIELCRATGDKQKYMEYKMTDVMISSVRPGGSSQGGEEIPLEEVSFNYGKIELTYTATGKDGKAAGDVKANWDVTANKGG